LPPYGINPEIKWAPGVEGGALMDKAHDIYWLNILENLFPKNFGKVNKVIEM